MNNKQNILYLDWLNNYYMLCSGEFSRLCRGHPLKGVGKYMHNNYIDNYDLVRKLIIDKSIYSISSPYIESLHVDVWNYCKDKRMEFKICYIN